jgi:hypothetical protein
MRRPAANRGVAEAVYVGCEGGRMGGRAAMKGRKRGFIVRCLASYREDSKKVLKQTTSS